MLIKVYLNEKSKKINIILASSLAIILLVASATLYSSKLNAENEANESNLIDQKYLFEYYYINHAWGFRFSGVYVDNNGNVVNYDYPGSEKFNRNRTEEGLDSRFNIKGHERIKDVFKKDAAPKVIEQAKIIEMFQKIDAASKGGYSKGVNTANDAGSYVFICYKFNKDTQKYTKVLLSEAGDWSKYNTSEEAKELVEWLKTVIPGSRSSSDFLE